MESTPIIEMIEITKIFPGVIANDRISFKVEAGEIHALLGENGAGKSTLMSILAGLYQPHAGTIRIKGQPVQFKSPRAALAAGVGMIYQHFRLVDNLTVAENIFLGTAQGPVALQQQKMEKATEELSKRFGLEINPSYRVSHLSLAEQQRVEILKMLYRGCDILIMDEPTTVLTPQEVRKLFGMLRTMAQEGKAVILITHKLNEVLEIADKVTVLRKGRVVGSAPVAQLDEKSLTQMMVGRELPAASIERRPNHEGVMLAIENLKVYGDKGYTAVHDLNLTIRAGEIMGIAGVAGNGQKELVEAIAGLRTVASGHIRLQGEEISQMTLKERLARGINMVPEDRMGMGLVPNMTIMENAILRNYRQKDFTRGLFLNYKKIRSFTARLISAYNIAAADMDYPVNYLSGGNLQKLVLGREISQSPRLLIASYPVRGLDVAAAEAVFQLLLAQRDKGTAILLILEDLEDIFRLSDRIGVMYDGTIRAVLDVEETDVEEVGLLMLGAGPKDVENGEA